MSASRKKIAEFLGNTERTVENWEKEGRYVTKFIRKYLNSNDIIDEFIQTGKINDLQKNIINNDEYIFKTAMFKIHMELNVKKLFKEILQDNKTVDKQSLYDQINAYKTKIIKGQHKNWKQLLTVFIDNYLTDQEIEIIIINKNRAIEYLK